MPSPVCWSQWATNRGKKTQADFTPLYFRAVQTQNWCQPISEREDLWTQHLRCSRTSKPLVFAKRPVADTRDWPEMTRSDLNFYSPSGETRSCDGYIGIPETSALLLQPRHLSQLKLGAGNVLPLPAQLSCPSRSFQQIWIPLSQGATVWGRTWTCQKSPAGTAPTITAPWAKQPQLGWLTEIHLQVLVSPFSFFPRALERREKAKFGEGSYSWMPVWLRGFL